MKGVDYMYTIIFVVVFIIANAFSYFYGKNIGFKEGQTNILKSIALAAPELIDTIEAKVNDFAKKINAGSVE